MDIEARKKLMARRKKLQLLNKWIRRIIQLVFFVLYPALFSQAFSGVKESINTIGNGGVLEFTSFTVKLIVLVIITIIFGRLFCGYACAFGAIGDWLYAFGTFISKKIKKKLPVIPLNIVYILQKVKYIVLFLVVVICLSGNGELITKYSPWTVFSMISVGNFNLKSYGIAITLLIIVACGMIVKERFFCQFLCPLGALFSLLPQLSWTRLKRNKKECINGCRLCQNNCPVNIKIGEKETRDGECIACMRCKNLCPKSNIGFK